MATALELRTFLKSTFNRYSTTLHFLGTLFVFLCGYWNLDLKLLFSHTAFLLLSIFLPGLAVIVSVKGLKIETPYLIGVAFAFGFILQNLNFFSLSLTHNTQFYTVSIGLILIFSLYLIFTKRENILSCVRNASFDFWHLTFYCGLALGLSLVRTKFIGPFDESISGYAWSPILEKHANLYAEHSLSNASDFPYSTYDPSGKPGHVMHPSLLGSAIATLNPNGRFPLYFPLLQIFILGFYSSACMLASCGTRLFNRPVAITTSIIYILYFFPNYLFPGLSSTPNLFIYFPQHLAILASLSFLLTTTIHNEQDHKPSATYFFVVAMVTTFACLINFQLLAVIFPAFMVYFSLCISQEKNIWDRVPWVLPITSACVACWYMFLLGNRIYPSIVRNGQSATLGFKPFGNLAKVYPEATGNELEYLFWLYFNSGFGLAVLGLFWFFFFKLRLKEILHTRSHLFLWLGISSSLFVGTFIYLEPGGSGIYFYMFSMFFLFIYGADFLCRRKYIPLFLSWLVITVILIFPQYSKLNHQMGSGYISIDIYRFASSLTKFFPSGSKIIWAGEILDSEVHDRSSCSGIIGRKCIYSKNLKMDIIFFKASHIISSYKLNIRDIPENIDAQLLKNLKLNTPVLKRQDITERYPNANIDVTKSPSNSIRIDLPIYVYALKRL